MASVLRPLLLGLAATATLFALAVACVLATHYKRHASGHAGSPKHAPIVCEPPNPGSTTPVHPQTKQPVDDIDPDIIPNEYERRPLTYIPVYKTPPQRRRARERNGAASPVDEELDKKDLQEEALLGGEQSPAPTIRFAHNHQQQATPPQLPHHLIAQATSPSSLYGNSPTLADFKQMAFEAYNQRNNQNVYYSLQRPSKGILTMPQRPVTSSVSAHGKIHHPEVVTRSNRIQESCI